MIIIGGTYKEKCFEPHWDEIYGSGLRAVETILALDEKLEIQYYSFGDQNIHENLKMISTVYNNFSFDLINSNSFTFYYDYPLREPFLYPWNFNSERDLALKVENKSNVLFYGLLESKPIVNGDKVVYDPQSPENPIPFRSNGSSANQLIYVANFSEVSNLAKSKEIAKIVDYFFDEEKVFALVLKQGPQGALVFKDKHTQPHIIPCFKTNRVWTIGSGDVFSATFAFNWFKTEDLEFSALEASKATALYSEFKTLRIKDFYDDYKFVELSIKDNPKGQIYLAGPFFTFQQRWIINEVRSSLLQMGLKVFSPYHDVGPGADSKIVVDDIEGLNNSSFVFAVLDGLDSGTLFEVGYAISKEKSVMCFVQNESKDSLLMLEGSNCHFENDLTSAIYKTYWMLNEIENE